MFTYLELSINHNHLSSAFQLHDASSGEGGWAPTGSAQPGGPSWPLLTPASSFPTCQVAMVTEQLSAHLGQVTHQLRKGAGRQASQVRSGELGWRRHGHPGRWADAAGQCQASPLRAGSGWGHVPISFHLPPAPGVGTALPSRKEEPTSPRAQRLPAGGWSWASRAGSWAPPPTASWGDLSDLPYPHLRKRQVSEHRRQNSPALESGSLGSRPSSATAK